MQIAAIKPVGLITIGPVSAPRFDSHHLFWIPDGTTSVRLLGDQPNITPPNDPIASKSCHIIPVITRQLF